MILQKDVISNDNQLLEDLAEQWKDESDTGFYRVMDNLPQPETRLTDGWNHQLQAYHFALHLPGIMLAMDMGTGKSKVIVDIMQNRQHMSNLIMCPKSAVGVWPREFGKHWGSHIKMDIIKLNLGSTEKNLKRAIKQIAISRVKKHAFTLVVNHEASWRGKLGRWFMKQDWDFIGVDESHRAKNPGGKFGIFVYQIGPMAKQRACLTGTPMPHSPLDCFAQFRFLEPGLFGINAHQFRQHYAVFEPLTLKNDTGERWAKWKEKELCYTSQGKKVPKSLQDKILKLQIEMQPLKHEKADVHKGGRTINRIVDIKNTEELNEIFQSITFRVMADDVLDLPPVLYTKIPLQLNAKALEIYNDLEEHFYALVDEGEITVRNALTKLIRCRQVASGYAVDDEKRITDLCMHKFDALDDILKGIDEPIVVFCNFNWEIDLCLKVAKENGLATGEITGRHHDLTDTSEMPEDIEFMAVNIKSGGAAIDLTRASLALYFSPTFSLGDYDQPLRRVHRPGQTRTTRFLQFVTQGTIEPTVYYANVKRRNAIKAVMEMRSNRNVG